MMRFSAFFFCDFIVIYQGAMVWPMSIVLYCLSKSARLRALLATIYLPSISISYQIISSTLPNNRFYNIDCVVKSLNIWPASGMLGPQEREWMNECVLVGKSVGSQC